MVPELKVRFVVIQKDTRVAIGVDQRNKKTTLNRGKNPLQTVRYKKNDVLRTKRPLIA